jgi:hypothetical protein
VCGEGDDEDNARSSDEEEDEADMSCNPGIGVPSKRLSERGEGDDDEEDEANDAARSRCNNVRFRSAFS